MEALQMYKFALKKERLDFTKGWASSEKDMIYEALCTPNADSVDSLAFDPEAGDGLRSIADKADSSSYDTILHTIAMDECDNIPDIATVY